MKMSMANCMRIGTFIKTNSPHVVEVLGTTGLDFGVIDQEHGPFDRSSVDLMMLAGRAARIPLFVRVPEISSAAILGALDVGAAGLLVPHVDTPAVAAEVVRHSKFKLGQRGFSNAGRWGNYGTIAVSDAIALGDEAELICMIESEEGVENAAAIAATRGVSGLMVGRVDLCLAMGMNNPADDRVVQATKEVIAAGKAAGIEVAIVVQSVDEAEVFVQHGASMLIVQSDQMFMRLSARATVERARHIGKKVA